MTAKRSIHPIIPSHLPEKENILDLQLHIHIPYRNSIRGAILYATASKDGGKKSGRIFPGRNFSLIRK